MFVKSLHVQSTVSFTDFGLDIEYSTHLLTKMDIIICNLQMRMERAQFIVRHAFEEDEAGNETEAAELYMEAAQLCIDLVKLYRIMCYLQPHHSNKSHTVRQIFHWVSLSAFFVNFRLEIAVINMCLLLSEKSCLGSSDQN